MTPQAPAFCTQFADRLDHFGNATALVTSDGRRLTYANLCDRADEFCRLIGQERQLVFLQTSNELEPLVAYLGALRGCHPVILAPHGRLDRFRDILEAYQPGVVYHPRNGKWELTRNSTRNDFHESLAVLLSTSGSTGSSKMVRLSNANIQSNAESICKYLEISSADRAITSLPFHYSYGLSVVNSHLSQGAALLLTNCSVVDAQFWELFRECQATSFAGVPYTFELLDHVGFSHMTLESLRCVTQAGGRLAKQSVLKYVKLSQERGWRFYVMYGQTEATARMSYLPPQIAQHHPDSIGVAIPDGEFRLIDESGRDIHASDIPGELVYSGPNVMLGYAEDRDDLSRGADIDELRTGDIACRNDEGIYRIVGRKSRFIKLFGSRVNLDDVEKQLCADGHRTVCTGTDQQLIIATLDTSRVALIRDFAASRLELPHHVVCVVPCVEYPTLPSGKVDYGQLRNLAMGTQAVPRGPRRVARVDETFVGTSPEGAESESLGETPLRTAFLKTLNVSDVDGDATFISLGGDSLSYVAMSLALEDHLGYSPRGWETMTIRQLEALHRNDSAVTEIDTSIVLRAIGIALVVGSHAQFSPIIGGAAILFLMAGVNFARFQGGSLIRGNLARPVGSLLKHLVAPYLVVTLAYQLWKGHFDVSLLLFYHNFLEPHGILTLFPVWFIQVLCQSIVLFSLAFLVPSVRRRTQTKPWPTAMGLVAISVLFNAVVSALWNTDSLYNRVPHKYLWVFALGWLIFFSNTRAQKVISTAVMALLLLSPISFHQTSASVCVFFAGMISIWVPRIYVVPFLKTLILTISASTYYIFLTHGVFIFNVAPGILKVASPGLAFLVAMVGGVGCWKLVQLATTLKNQFAQKSLNWRTPCEPDAF